MCPVGRALREWDHGEIGMVTERNPLVSIVIALVAVLLVAGVGAYYVATLPPPESHISAGTTIWPPGLEFPFTVQGPSATLLGAWYGNKGGLFWVVPENESSGLLRPVCGASHPWSGQVNVSLLPGRYLVGFAPNPNGTIVVTESIHLVYPGRSEISHGLVEGEGCTPPNIIPP